MRSVSHLLLVLFSLFLYSGSVNAASGERGAIFSGRVGGDIRTVYSNITLSKSVSSQNSMTLSVWIEGSNVKLLRKEHHDNAVIEVDM